MRTPFLGLLKSAARAWWDDDALRLGASLAFYTLFAIGPVLLVATAIAGMVFGAEAVRGEIVGQLDDLVGRDGALAVQSLLEGASQRQAGVFATVIGSIAFLIAATSAFLELQVALNTIWRVKPKAGAYIRALMVDRLRSFGLVVAVGFLLLVSLVVTAALAAFSAWISRRAPGFPAVLSVVSQVVSLVVTSGLFAMLFRFLPDVRLHWRDVATGAVVTAVLFMVGQQAIGFYLGQSTTAISYGAAGSVMILLLWVYYSCQILLFGAEFTRMWAARHGVKPKPEAFAEKDPDAVHPKSALALLLALWLATGAVAAQPTYDHLRIIAPAAPGGGWDQTARAMQQALQGSGIVKSSSVENIAGAAGTIGLARLISAERGAGDVAMISGLIMLGAVITHRSPVTLADVTPIARLTGEYEAIVVPAQSPYRTLGALIDAFRARPESISWGGGSAGGTDQILAGLVADAVGVSPRRVNYIAFSGGGESMSAILGGQVTAGISGLGEYASQLAAGTLRILAISSAERVPGVDAPTLREQGVDVVLENWRSLVGPPGMSAADRARLERAVEAMVASAAWREMLQRYRWNDRYLAGQPFEQFLASEEARVESILEKLGTGTDSAAPSSIGRYPIVVFGGLLLTVAAFMITLVRNRGDGDAHIDRRAIAIIAVAIALNVILIEAAGFVIASLVLFWLTARAFDPRHPVRDAIAAVVLSVGAYLLFVRLLQIQLP